MRRLGDEVAMSEFDYKLRRGLLASDFRVIYIFIYSGKWSYLDH